MMERYRIDAACLPVEFLVMGMLQNNVYLITVGDQVMVVDPSCNADAIMKAVGDRTVGAIVLTHRHGDHAGAACELRERTGAPVIATAIDAEWIEGRKHENAGGEYDPCIVDTKVQHGDTITVGSVAWKVIGTPGHTPGSMCLYVDPRLGSDPENPGLLVSGDTLFEGTIGRTDFDGGSMDDMRSSLVRLAELPDDTVVLPGHGPITAIGRERARVFAQYAR